MHGTQNSLYQIIQHPVMLKYLKPSFRTPWNQLIGAELHIEQIDLGVSSAFLLQVTSTSSFSLPSQSRCCLHPVLRLRALICSKQASLSPPCAVLLLDFICCPINIPLNIDYYPLSLECTIAFSSIQGHSFLPDGAQVLERED